MLNGGGRVRPITYYGEPVLHRPCAEVTVFDDSLATLVDDMFASMYAVGGVGLAANQIGVGLRVFVYDCIDADGERHVGHLVNPTLTTAVALAGTVTGPEGCLSVPGAGADVPRAALATSRGVDVRGVPVTVSGSGTLARCLQHEQDHLEGRVYVDLLAPAHRDRILTKAGLTP
ncbi:MAG TPA: peptide deformylase [Pseudonocardiaceae bacterium]